MLEPILFDTAAIPRSLRGAGSDGSRLVTGVSVCFNLLLSGAYESKLIESASWESSSAAGFGVLVMPKLVGTGSSAISSSSACDGIGDNRPPRLLTVEAFDEVRGRAKLSPRGNGRGDSDSGIVSNESELELFVGDAFPGELARFTSRVRFTDKCGLDGHSSSSLIFSFFVRPRFLSDFGAESSDPERRRLVLPPFASGFNIHQELFPFPSFCTLTNLLCSDKLWRIEFCNEETHKKNKDTL